MGGFGNFSGQLDKSLDNSIASNRSFVVNDLAGRRVGPIPLIAAAQTLTVAYADLGVSEFACDGFSWVRLYLKIIKQNSDQIRVKAFIKHTTGGDAFVLPIAIPVISGSPAYYDLRAEYVQFTASELAATDYVSCEWKLNNSVPFMKFQVMMGVDGGADGTIESANITLAY